MSKFREEAQKAKSDWSYNMNSDVFYLKKQVEKITDPHAKEVALKKIEEVALKVKIMTENLNSVRLELRAVSTLVDNYQEMESTMDM